MMGDKEYAYQFTNLDILQSYTGRLDGNSTNRILFETIKMVSDKT